MRLAQGSGLFHLQLHLLSAVDFLQSLLYVLRKVLLTLLSLLKLHFAAKLRRPLLHLLHQAGGVCPATLGLHLQLITLSPYFIFLSSYLNHLPRKHPIAYLNLVLPGLAPSPLWLSCLLIVLSEFTQKMP